MAKNQLLSFSIENAMLAVVNNDHRVPEKCKGDVQIKTENPFSLQDEYESLDKNNPCKLFLRSPK